MKGNKKFLLLFVVFLSTFLSAQKNDYVWLSGYDSEYWQDTFWINDTHYLMPGITRLDFNEEPLGMYHDSIRMQFTRTNVFYSDDNGDLLFYSNGVSVANKWHEFLPNCQYLNEGWFINEWDTEMLTGGGIGIRKELWQ